MLLMTDIHVRSFSGGGIRLYAHSVAKLLCEVLKEHSHLEDPDLGSLSQHLTKLSTNKEAIVVLIFDHTTLVGASLGHPLSCAKEPFQQPFKEKLLPLSPYYFFGESVLLKPYRGRGIGHHFFDAREAHLINQPQFRHICLPVPLSSDAGNPSIPLHDFCRKRGYVHHPEIQTRLLKKAKGLGEGLREHVVTFWIKDLAPSAAPTAS